MPRKKKQIKKKASRASAKAPKKKAPKRQALGRGLSALMAATSTPVEVAPPKLKAKLKAKREAAPKLAERKTVMRSEGAALRKEEFEPELAVVEGVAHGSAEAVSEELPAAEDATLDGLSFISLERLRPNPKQPRKRFQLDEIKALASSIRESGVLQPLVVRPVEGSVRDFEIVAGERRFRAAREAGLAQVPAIVRDLSDKETLQIGIIENVQRADLNPMEEAAAYERLIAEFAETQASVAASVGRDRVSVANTLRLLKLPEDVQNLISQAKLSPGHGRAVLMLEGPREQKALANRIVKQGLSVRAAEQLAQLRLGKSPRRVTEASKARKSAPKSPQVIRLEERLRRALGTKVNLSLNDVGKGELTVSFFSQEEFESFLERVRA